MNLYTIGYEGINQKAFIAWLHKYSINFVADIRERPLSRKPGFSKNHLTELLQNEKIEYKSYPELGTTKPMRDKLYKTHDYHSFFSQYQKLISGKSEHLEEIHQLLKNGKNVVLLCYEKDAETCHRKITASEIKKKNGNGLKIRHIIPL